LITWWPVSKIQAEYGTRLAAMTLGEYGSLALYQSRWYYSPAFEVICADTTGAGDVYHGAFCYAILAGMQMEKALEFSNAAAAINCTAIGARGHIPELCEIEALIAKGRTGETRRLEDAEVAGRVRAQGTKK
jgi:sulfofructose kinase